MATSTMTAPAIKPRKRGRPFLESLALPSWVTVIVFLGSTVAYLLYHVPFWGVVAGHFGAFSLVTFLTFGLDKWLARREKRRVSEFNLLLLAALGGAVGGLAGMALWRHKGQRKKFRLLLPTFLFLHAAVMLLVLVK